MTKNKTTAAAAGEALCLPVADLRIGDHVLLETQYLCLIAKLRVPKQKIVQLVFCSPRGTQEVRFLAPGTTLHVWRVPKTHSSASPA